jgi:hypothetical protein
MARLIPVVVTKVGTASVPTAAVVATLQDKSGQLWHCCCYGADRFVGHFAADKREPIQRG